MRQIYLISIFLLFTSLCFSSIKGKVIDQKGESIPGTNVYWLHTTVGAVTDLNGEFELAQHDKSNQIVVSNIAYVSDTVAVTADQKILISLKEVRQLAELSVVSKTPGTIKQRSAIFQTEKITGAELCKAACCNLSESFETNPSVDVSYSDAATGAKQIKMLGLSGSYVQMLTENIPNLRGISSSYGLGFIPGPWMESIQVSKGTASVVNGYEAITGQINVEYKKPQSSEIVAANVFASDAGRFEGNVNASAKLSNELSTGILLHASDEIKAIDDNGDNFMDMPMVKQYNFINRWYYKKSDYISQAFIRALSEDRVGGTMDENYKIGINTKRYEFFLKNGYVFDNVKGTSVGFIVSGSHHNQDANYGAKHYQGRQDNLYANLIYQTSFSEMHKLSTGLSFNYDKYDEKLTIGTLTAFPRQETTPGAFAEYTFNLNDNFIALAGLRADYNSLYGAFVTPRLHLKYNASEHLNFRASAGKGYRSPNVLAENNFLLASNRQMNIANDLKMEEAWNYGLSSQVLFPVLGRELSLTGEWYLTNFVNQVVVDMDSNPHAVSFTNLTGKSYSSSAQLEANMEIMKGLSLTMAHRITDVKTTIAGQLRDKPLTDRSKSLITVSYQTPLKKWQFDYTAQFSGGGRLPDPDAANALWNSTYKPYNMMNAQVTKYFRTWSVYVGSENLTNFVQKNPIIDVQNPYSNDFDAAMVWGPVHGRKLYVGLRWAIDREE